MSYMLVTMRKRDESPPSLGNLTVEWAYQAEERKSPGKSMSVTPSETTERVFGLRRVS
jgi:hypothetical protein